MLFGDIYDIERRLKQFDRDFDISYNEQTHKYTITHKKHYFMTVNVGELDDRVMKHIKKTVWLNNQNMLNEEIEKHNKKIEREQEKSVEDMAYNMAKDIRKPLIKEALGA